MARKIVHLIFTQKLIKKPLIFTIAKQYDIIPNVRRASITDKIGEVTLELSGKIENLDKAIRRFERSGVKVEPIVGDIVE